MRPTPGSFQRSFQVPEGVSAEKVEANFKNGILTVTLPKAVEAQKQEEEDRYQGGIN